MVAPPEWRETADPVATAAFAERNVLVLGYVLPAYAAVEVARQAIMESGTPDAPLSDDLSNREFSTALGAVKFDAKGDLATYAFALRALRDAG